MCLCVVTDQYWLTVFGVWVYCKVRNLFIICTLHLLSDSRVHLSSLHILWRKFWSVGCLWCLYWNVIVTFLLLQMLVHKSNLFQLLLIIYSPEYILTVQKFWCLETWHLEMRVGTPVSLGTASARHLPVHIFMLLTVSYQHIFSSWWNCSHIWAVFVI